MMEVAAICIGVGFMWGFSSCTKKMKAVNLGRAYRINELKGLGDLLESDPLCNTVVVFGTAPVENNCSEALCVFSAPSLPRSSFPILESITSFLSSLLDILWNLKPLQIAGCLSLVAAGSYSISCYDKERHSSYLKSATSVDRLKDLVDRFENNNTPLVAKVTGKVFSDAPIGFCLPNLDSDVESKLPLVTTLVQSQSDSVSCVIYEGETEIVYEDRARNGDRFSSVMEVKSIHDEVPWYLADDTGKVYVEGIQKAKGFDLVSRKREVAGPGTAFLRELGFVREIENRRGMKILGVKHIECALEVDSALTVVGKAVKDNNGNITIQDPLFVCQSDSETYAKSLSTVFDQPSAWKIASVFALVTMLVLSTIEGVIAFGSRSQEEKENKRQE